jgi:hypothetical protein
MRFQSNSQLQKRSEGNIDHSLFDLRDLAIVNTTGIRHFTETKAFVLAELSQIFSESFQYLFVGGSNHTLYYGKPKLDDFLKRAEVL